MLKLLALLLRISVYAKQELSILASIIGAVRIASRTIMPSRDTIEVRVDNLHCKRVQKFNIMLQLATLVLVDRARKNKTVRRLDGQCVKENAIWVA